MSTGTKVKLKLYRVNYEECLQFEEFIEADSEEHAKVIFQNSIDTLDPVDGEVYEFTAECTTPEETPKGIW